MTFQITNISATFGLDSFVVKVARTHNKKLNAIIFLRGLSVNQSVVLRTNILQVQKMRTTLWNVIYLFVRIFCGECIAPKPSKKLLRQALLRYASYL
ncbi:MAG TPA: hypothetical protein DCQ93_09650 [Bacteroidetes bacterium]|nr:hypothetical protein [Bacteroidota bacterium]